MSFALLCPGQGAQVEGFLSPVLAGPEATPLRAALEHAVGMPFHQIEALPLARLRENRIAQPALAAFQLALWSRIRALLPRPALAAGYSLGEVIAAACAGAMPPEAAIDLARVRAGLMDDAHAAPAAMLALRGARQDLAEALAHAAGWFVALRNGEDRFVLAGLTAQAAALRAQAERAGLQVTPIGVATPSHTPLLQGAVAPFEAALAAHLSAEPAFPVLSALDGSAMRLRSVLALRLARALAEPLDWASTMDALAERGIHVCLELGPGADLARMMSERHPAIACRSVAEFDTPEAACAWVAAQMQTAPAGPGPC